MSPKKIILPKKYRAQTLVDLYFMTESRVDAKANLCYEHFTGFSVAYIYVGAILSILSFFVQEGFLRTMIDIFLGDNWLIFLVSFLYMANVNNIFAFLCRKVHILVYNPLDSREYLNFISYAILAECMEENGGVAPDRIDKEYVVGEVRLKINTTLTIRPQAEETDVVSFEWLDADVDKF